MEISVVFDPAAKSEKLDSAPEDWLGWRSSGLQPLPDGPRESAATPQCSGAS